MLQLNAALPCVSKTYQQQQLFLAAALPGNQCHCALKPLPHSCPLRAPPNPPTCSAYAATQSRVQFLDCSQRFLNSNRTAIDATLLPDSLHPSAAGMERGIAQCIKPLVDLLMQVGW